MNQGLIGLVVSPCPPFARGACLNLLTSDRQEWPDHFAIPQPHAGHRQGVESTNGMKQQTLGLIVCVVARGHGSAAVRCAHLLKPCIARLSRLALKPLSHIGVNVQRLADKVQ